MLRVSHKCIVYIIDHVPTFLHMSLQCSFWYVVDHRGIFDGRPIGHHGHGFLRVLSRPQFIMFDMPVLVSIPAFSMMLFTVRFTSIVVLTINSNPFIITRNVGGSANNSHFPNDIFKVKNWFLVLRPSRSIISRHLGIGNSV